MAEKIILSPHIDDAILSMGGQILAWKQQSETVRIIDIFSKMSYVYGTFLPWQLATLIRRREEQKIANELGLEIIYRDLPEAYLRGYRTIDSFFDGTIERVNKEASLLQSVMSAIPSGELFIPMSIGNHIDHQLVTVAALQKNSKYIFYEDMPYAASGINSEIKDQLVERYGLQKRTIKIDIEMKKKLVLSYKSQPVKNWVSLIVNYALRNNGEIQYVQQL